MYLYTIQLSDVNRSTIKVGGKTYWLASAIGRVLPGDVGKRVFIRDGVLSVENDEQRDKRLARGKG